MRNVFLGTVILLGALLAACSGSLGGSSALPGGQPPLQQQGPGGGVAPAGGATVKPSSTPDSVSAQLTVNGGGSVTLPSAGDYSITIALPKTTASPYTISATTSLVPSDSVPDIAGPSDKSKRGVLGHGKSPRKPYAGLVYVSITPSTTLELDELPKVSFMVPQPALDKYGGTPELELAYLDSTVKGLPYKMAVAERIAATPTPVPTGSGAATPTPSPSPSPTPTPVPSLSPGNKLPTFPPALAATPPPKVTVNFASAATPLKLQAGKTYTFVLYVVLPEPSPSPHPSGAGSASPSASGSPAAASSGTPAASGSPGAAASGSATGSPAPSATGGSPSATASSSASGGASSTPPS